MKFEILVCLILAIMANVFLKEDLLCVNALLVLPDNIVRHVTHVVRIHVKLDNVFLREAHSFVNVLQVTLARGKIHRAFQLIQFFLIISINYQM